MWEDVWRGCVFWRILCDFLELFDAHFGGEISNHFVVELVAETHFGEEEFFFSEFVVEFSIFEFEFS